MHHFIYPTQDAYISNKSTEVNKNFGLDEMLVVGVSQSYSRTVNPTKTYSFYNNYVAGMQVEDFTGKFTGSAFLYYATSSGTINGEYNSFSSGFFSGSLTGSVVGYETGSSLTNFNFSGSLRGFSGQIVSNVIAGWVSGSLSTSCFSTFTGTLSDATGSLTGYLTGDEIKDEQNISVVNRKFIKRSLLKFDLSFISQSIVSGDITNPKFYLKMYSTEARELPIEYSVFAFPLTQTWVQGNGYFSDGGSNEGVNWNWRDKYSGSVWFTPQRTDIITSSIDYLGNYGYVSESFIRGGGTWHNVSCSQSFSYQSSDLNIDVTSIVNSWLNQSVPNNGIIVMCSEETNPSGSNAHLFFFSRETNTIYSPHLDVAWDDQVWLTGSYGTGSVTVYPQTGSLNNVFTNGFLSSTNINSIISCSMVSNYQPTVTYEITGSLTGSIDFNYVVQTPVITQFTQSVGLVNTLLNLDPFNVTIGGSGSWQYSWGYHFTIGNDKYSLSTGSFRIREVTSGSIIDIFLFETGSIGSFIPQSTDSPLNVTFSYNPSTVTGVFSDIHFIPTTEVILEKSRSYLLLVSIPSSSAEYEIAYQTDANNRNSYFPLNAVTTYTTIVSRYDNGVSYVWSGSLSENNLTIRLGVDEVFSTSSVVYTSSTSSYFATGSNGYTYTGSISGSITSGSLNATVISGDLSGSFITGSSDGNQFSGSYNGTFGTYFNPYFTGSFSGSGIYGSLSSKYVFGNLTGSIISGSISASIYSGNLSGSFITGSSDGTYFVSGLYDSKYFLSSSLITGGMSGSILANAFITSSLYSGYVAGYISGQSISGIFTTGDLIGTTFVGSVVGSYSTSSYFVETIITSSVFHPINSEKPFVVTVQNLKKELSFADNPRIGLFAREKMPLKTFEKSSQQLAYVVTKLLPSSSFYAIKDNETEEFIIDFDSYTKISCDLDGHYFDLNTSALEKERYYKIVIKIDCLDGNIYTFDNNAVFKVRR